MDKIVYVDFQNRSAATPQETKHISDCQYRTRILELLTPYLDQAGEKYSRDDITDIRQLLGNMGTRSELPDQPA